MDPYDDFKDITENVESDLIKCILDNEEFLDTVGFNLIVLPYIIHAAFSNSTLINMIINMMNDVFFKFLIHIIHELWVVRILEFGICLRRSIIRRIDTQEFQHKLDKILYFSQFAESVGIICDRIFFYKMAEKGTFIC